MLIRLLFILALLLPSVSHAVTFWDEGWESGQLSPNWSTGSCQYMTPGGSPWANGCNPTVSSDVARTGTYSLKKDYTTPLIPDGGGGTHGEWIDRSFGTSTSDLYIRWWEYEMDFVPDPARSKIFYIGLSAPNFIVVHAWGQPYISIDSQQEVGGVPPCNGSYTSCLYPPTVKQVPIPDRTWTCVEAHIKLNTLGQANGVMELWVAGELTLQYLNRTFRDASGIGGVTMNDLSAVRIFTQAGGGKVYIDDYAVGNSRFGCGSSAPLPSDTTAPTTPTGLAVN